MADETKPMTAVRHFKPTNRLADMIRLPGGKTVREAVAAATAAIELYRPEVIDDIDAAIAELEQLIAEAQPEHPIRHRIYHLSSNILEHAGLFDLEDVGKAAYSLCELVDRLAQRHAWDAAAVAVHVSSIRLLRDMGPGAELQRAQLLKGLHAVVAKMTPETAPSAA